VRAHPWIASRAATPALRRAHWKQFDTFARNLEPPYRNSARRLFNAERNALVSLLRRDLDEKGVTRRSVRRALRSVRQAFKNSFIGTWADTWRDLNARSSSLVTMQLGDDFDLTFDPASPQIQKLLRQRSSLVKGVPRNTRKALLSSIQEGATRGESRAQIVRRVENVYAQGFFKGSIRVPATADRIAMIARTETTAITNGTALAGVRSLEQDDLFDKEWNTQGDDRVRPEHSAMEGEKVAVDARFSNGLEYPQEPNCRCFLTFVRRRRRRPRRR